MSASVSGNRHVRIAVEGCGHGTLHAIYASVEESCKAKGWDTVDLLIIGGDFQAARNAYDLNVAAMPQKYRRMADFYEYYSGARVAPYLTLFIGGNHEASNYLFELYYGGWVAPNIYYMGAANILRLGPLRIAGLSGIWKGYDYRKPHFERLPYNTDDYHSIFHVRELDVRKLLSVRSQVDIGLSHDWPKGVEWRGDHRWLFSRKDRFEADAINGKLGSVAAAQCLDRLRPAYWFSAHLHIKYPAMILHGQQQEVRTKHVFNQELSNRNPKLEYESRETASTLIHGEVSLSSSNMPPQPASNLPQLNGHRTQPLERPEISAWQNFHIRAQQDDAEERDRVLKERKERQEEEARTGVRPKPQYIFAETFKQVKTNEDFGRSITSVETSVQNPGTGSHVPNLDGCGSSSLKRRRETSSPEVNEQQPDQNVPAHVDHAESATIGMLDGTAASTAALVSTTENNPDAVEMDLDDTDTETASTKSLETTRPETIDQSSTAPALTQATPVLKAGTSDHTTNGSHGQLISSSIISDDAEDGGVRLNPLAQSFQPLPIKFSRTEHKKSEETTPSEQPFTSSSWVTERVEVDDMNPLAESFTPRESISSQAERRKEDVSFDQKMVPGSNTVSTTEDERKLMSDELGHDQVGGGGAPMIDNEVSEEMRAQLAALSGSFAPMSIKKSEPLPFPEAIKNEATQFLALDKCEHNREFLQLLEVEAISDTPLQGPPNRPLKLQYDPEWLAILRVFAPDLELGGNAKSVVAPDRGETYYRDRIAEEAQWIDEHITKKGLLEVPENFTTTAPVYDPGLRVDSSEMPREYTNLQTSEFCNLIGIDNHFDISEEERDARIASGPRPETDRRIFQGGRGRGGRFNNNRGQGRGGRQGGGGRGRGRW